jgi:hypothetical protein
MMGRGSGGHWPPTPSPAAGLSADAGARAAPVRADAGAKAPPAAQLAHIKIESRPPGVEVFEGGRSLGLTPTTWDGIKRDAPFTLYGEKDGFDYREMTLNPIVEDGKTVTLVLKKAKSGKGKRLSRPPAGATGTSGGNGDNTAGGDLIPPSK